MRLPDSSSNNNTLGARRIQMNTPNDSFNNPKIQTESGFNMGQFANNFSNMAQDPTMQNIAGNILKDQVSKQTQGISGMFSFDIVRPYFHIDNSYILKKLKLIFLPFLQKGDWKSTEDVDYMGSNMEYENYKANIDKIDPFGVDLYLPIMSLITFTLIVGFYQGITGTFDPEILGYMVGKICFIWLVESIAIKVMFIIGGVQNSPFMELI